MRKIWWESRLGLGCIFRQWHWWSMTDEWWLNLSQRLDLPLEIIKAKLVLSEFFGLFIMEMERPITIALVLPGNRFYGLESVSFSFFSSAISITELFILLLCTRKTHLESECIGIQSLVEVSVTSGKKIHNVFFMMHNLVFDVLHSWKQNSEWNCQDLSICFAELY